jgi:thiol:disulfide interchange protein DsbD
VKGILGFIEIIAAWKFFSATIGRFGLDSVISREVIYAIWGLLLIAMSLYLLGRFRFPHDSPLEKIGAPRVLLALVFLVLAGLCGWAVAGKTWDKNLESQLLVKSFHSTEAAADWRILSHENPVPWEQVLAEIDARVAAGGARKPILINFTGHV